MNSVTDRYASFHRENGEKTNPVPMEGALRACPIIRHATVIGEKRQCTAALVELDLEKAVEHTPSEMIELGMHKAVIESKFSFWLTDTLGSYSTSPGSSQGCQQGCP